MGLKVSLRRLNFKTQLENRSDRGVSGIVSKLVRVEVKLSRRTTKNNFVNVSVPLLLSLKLFWAR